MNMVQNESVLNHENVDIEILTWYEYADHGSKIQPNSQNLAIFCCHKNSNLHTLTNYERISYSIR